MANIPADSIDRALPVRAWPAGDRAAWHAALAHGADLLEETGPAAHWAANTCRTVAMAYGLWLRFLDHRGWLDVRADPSARLTRERVRAYVEHCQGRCSPVTVAGRIRNLIEAVRVMAPEADLTWLQRAERRLTARAAPTRAKTPHLRSARELYELGFHLMARAEADATSRARWRAARYRDGLIVAILAAVPIRVQTLADLTVDGTLVRADDIFWIRLPAGTTKNGDPFDAPLPAALTPWLDRYLAVHRPSLLASTHSPRVWISWQATALTANTIATRVRKVTGQAFGVAISPHRFRDAAATSLAVEDPDHTPAAAALLQHRSLRTTQHHYNQGRQLEAQRAHAAAVQSRRARRR